MAAFVPAAFAAQATQVKVDTNMGAFVIELNAKAAPKTVENFLAYVKSGFYKNTLFHRVIPNFMIQGGGFVMGMEEKDTRAPIALESRNGLSNVRGTIAMARTNDPNSATSQFFINVRDNRFLDANQAQDGNGYAVFGKVVSGMSTVDAIARVKTHSVGYYDDVPIRDVVIKNMSVIKGK
ncbi:peptidylprolyl isomerase [Parasutterella secunda]|nr:peptidylprolyl isomerase [Parasutterella secunda]MDM8087036.1 peptidylprolyl isomerase [Parasutterella secunda]MDM8225677.1 peptidylprolyl isomerase [Parasutterella secunda]HJI94442.1 peptidylprolyl isomerase [Sutterellaceae bacterium]